jgi:hypothetical protein
LGDPICGAMGRPRRAGPASRLTGDFGRPLHVGEEEEEEEGGKGADERGQAVRERERESVCGAGAGPREKERRGLRVELMGWLGWLGLVSYFLSLSSFQTQTQTY